MLGASESSISRLSGGLNSEVYKCSDGCNSWVIKSYSSDDNLSSQRMNAEIELLRFASEVAPGMTPYIFEFDIANKCLITNFIEGKPFSAGEYPTNDDIGDAITFFRYLNSDLKAAKTSVSVFATEGFMSLTEHLENVSSRIARMQTEHLPVSVRGSGTILLSKLNVKLEHLVLNTQRVLGSGECSDYIQPDELCISASDFGFHNAIRTANGVRFIDFEFGGWDDPTKAVIDFDLQPRVPTRSSMTLLSALEAKMQSTVLRRFKAMQPILILKWCCILSQFLDQSRLTKIRMLNEEITGEGLLTERISQIDTMLKKLELSYG